MHLMFQCPKPITFFFLLAICIESSVTVTMNGGVMQNNIANGSIYVGFIPHELKVYDAVVAGKEPMRN